MPRDKKNTDLIVSNEPPPYEPVELGIGRRIKKQRELLGLNFEELAALSKLWDYDGKGPGIAAVTLRRYEREDGSATLPGLRELRILCAAFDVTADSLLLDASPTSYEEEERKHWDAFKSLIAWAANPERAPGTDTSEAIRALQRRTRLQQALLHTKKKTDSD
ncbi:MAG: hypothetical protein JWO88_3629 [Frankiales bacterium]|nr:hypothetical protein [Frankiales bacterium]